MNTILEIKEVCGVWLVGILTPDGTPLLINHMGAREEAIQKALWAAPELV